MILARLALVSWSAGLLLGCGGSDPEAAIRERLAAAEQAAEERDTGFFRDFVAESYSDPRGYGRDEVINLIRGYFLAHARLEIVSRVDEVTLSGPDAGRAVLHAGMLGQRAGESLLGGVAGDWYRFEIDLIRDGGDWRVSSASWASWDSALGE